MGRQADSCQAPAASKEAVPDTFNMVRNIDFADFFLSGKSSGRKLPNVLGNADDPVRQVTGKGKGRFLLGGEVRPEVYQPLPFPVIDYIIWSGILYTVEILTPPGYLVSPENIPNNCGLPCEPIHFEGCLTFKGIIGYPFNHFPTSGDDAIPFAPPDSLVARSCRESVEVSPEKRDLLRKTIIMSPESRRFWP